MHTQAEIRTARVAHTPTHCTVSVAAYMKRGVFGGAAAVRGHQEGSWEQQAQHAAAPHEESCVWAPGASH